MLTSFELLAGCGVTLFRCLRKLQNNDTNYSVLFFHHTLKSKDIHVYPFTHFSMLHIATVGYLIFVPNRTSCNHVHEKPATWRIEACSLLYQ